MYKNFTVAGSSKISNQEYTLLLNLTKRIILNGLTCYGGADEGSDDAALSGYNIALLEDNLKVQDRFTLFLPKDKHRDLNIKHNNSFVDVTTLSNYEKAKEILADQMDITTLDLDTLNVYITKVYQVLGKNLDSTSSANFVIYCDDPSNDKCVVKELATRNKIPVFNMRVPESKSELGRFMQQQGWYN